MRRFAARCYNSTFLKRGVLREFETIAEVLRWRASTQPDRLAFRFLVDGESQTASITYAELDRQANEIAAALSARCKPGDRALLLYPPGLDFISGFFGCLYAGIVAVPLYSPRPNRADPRLDAVAANCGATVALSTGDVLAKLRAQRLKIECLEGLDQIATDSMASNVSPPAKAPVPARGETLAFLQYTSGSTAAPRGVMVSHANLMANEAMIRVAFDWHENSSVVSWLPVYHDMGLIGNVLQPVYAGIPGILMPPAAFLMNPFRWLEVTSRYRGTCIGAPNFAYDLCARRVTPEQIATLDLSCVDLAYCGAEPIRHDAVERFLTAFAPAGLRPEAFYPCYGLAEATLFSTGGSKAARPVMVEVQASALESHLVVPPSPDDDRRTLVGCGRPWMGASAAIVEPSTFKPCLFGSIGEIWLAGPHVAAGYWNDHEATGTTFNARLADDDRAFLRTGDLGFVRDGELFITGRIKDVIIIRGRNLYPQDIEATVEKSHPALRPGRGAAFIAEQDGEERLVVIHEVDRDVEYAELKPAIALIRQAVARDHGVAPHAVVLVEAFSVPTTTSGKIRRAACRQFMLNHQLKVQATDSPELLDYRDTQVQLTTTDRRIA